MTSQHKMKIKLQNAQEKIKEQKQRGNVRWKGKEGFGTLVDAKNKTVNETKNDINITGEISEKDLKLNEEQKEKILKRTKRSNGKSTGSNSNGKKNLTLAMFWKK